MASALGFRAARYGKAVDWLAFIVVSITGIFFHLFVLFAFTNVVFFSMTYRKSETLPLRTLIISFFVILMVAIIAVVQFGSLAGEHTSLFAFGTPSQVILGGLGLLPLFPAPWTAYIFGFILLLLTLLGICRVGKTISVGIAIFLQISVILAMDAHYNYFASARQLLMLLPLTGVFTARGLRILFVWLDRLSRKFGFHISRLTIRTGMLFFLLTVAGFTLIPYYRTEKTSTRTILETLEQTREPGEVVFVSPDYTLPVYLYYAPWLKNYLRPFNHAEVANATFVISDPDADHGSSFELIYEASTPSIYPQALWIKK